MTWVCGLIFLVGAVPFVQAWRTLRHTSLVHALVWAATAWLAWGTVALLDQIVSDSMMTAARYTALCLVGCAGVAVLGARRPGVAAWDFVVLGLLAVLVLFLAEGAVVGGELQLGPVRITFLGLTLAIGIANYLPTRMALAAILLGLGCGWELWELVQRAGGAAASGFARAYADLTILCVPPAAAVCGLRVRKTGTDADRLWRSFRDSFGVIWGLRLREQFDRAAVNAGLPLELGWDGLRPATGEEPDAHGSDAALAILRALLKRFGPPPVEPPAAALERAGPLAPSLADPNHQ